MIRGLFRLFFVTLRDKLGGVMISADAAVDVEVERDQESVRGAIEENLHPGRIVVVVEEGDDFTDKAGGCFKKTAVKRNGPVLVHTACRASTEVILHVFGSLTDEMNMLEVAGKRRLFGGGMLSLVVILFHPLPERLVEGLKTQAVTKCREELRSQSFEPAFDLASSFRFIGSGVN